MGRIQDWRCAHFLMKMKGMHLSYKIRKEKMLSETEHDSQFGLESPIIIIIIVLLNHILSN